MHVYSAGQWVLLFFLYCFLGWVWESCYVSVCRRQWVNRGFLHGPLLPIYGSGAILILFVTLPAEENLWLVWLLGMIAATALEYVTGDVMERLFKVRYWDYSKKRFNLNGHICLSSSIAWGFFSILLVRFLHPPVGRLLTSVPAFLVDPAALALTAAFTVDVVRSTQAALDLREILTRLTEENEELRRIAKRVEVVSAFAEDDLRRFREKTEVEKLLLQERLESARTQRKLRRREALEESLRRRTSAKLKALRNIAQALEAYQARLESELTGEALERRRAEIGEALEKLRDREAAVRARTERTYRQAVRILRGNPTASSGGRLSEALESLRRLSDGDRD
ncbi:putative ABC transporter permease [Dysosmobacter sp. Phy]